MKVIEGMKITVGPGGNWGQFELLREVRNLLDPDGKADDKIMEFELSRVCVLTMTWPNDGGPAKGVLDVDIQRRVWEYSANRSYNLSAEYIFVGVERFQLKPTTRSSFTSGPEDYEEWAKAYLAEKRTREEIREQATNELMSADFETTKPKF